MRIKLDELKLGLYKVYWKSGGCSEASLYMGEGAQLYIAPANWVSPGRLEGMLDEITDMVHIPTENKQQWFVDYDLRIYETNVFYRYKTQGVIVRAGVLMVVDLTRLFEFKSSAILFALNEVTNEYKRVTKQSDQLMALIRESSEPERDEDE